MYPRSRSTRMADAHCLISRKAFLPVHPPNTLQHLPLEAHIGPVDPATMPADANQPTEEELRIAEARANLPPPSAAINLRDIEV